MDLTFEFLETHMPFLAVALSLWLIGHFAERSVFTTARVGEFPRPKRGRPDRRTLARKLHHWFFYWGRESLELHPLATALLIGHFWTNPEGADPAWAPWASEAYFVLAGVASLVGWKVVQILGRRFGVQLPDDPRLPGES